MVAVLSQLSHASQPEDRAFATIRSQQLHRVFSLNQVIRNESVMNEVSVAFDCPRHRFAGVMPAEGTVLVCRDGGVELGFQNQLDFIE